SKVRTIRSTYATNGKKQPECREPYDDGDDGVEARPQRKPDERGKEHELHGGDVHPVWRQNSQSDGRYRNRRPWREVAPQIKWPEQRAAEAAVGLRIKERVASDDEAGGDTRAQGRPANEQRHQADGNADGQ